MYKINKMIKRDNTACLQSL